jgi:hypothetical protein
MLRRRTAGSWLIEVWPPIALSPMIRRKSFSCFLYFLTGRQSLIDHSKLEDNVNTRPVSSGVGALHPPERSEVIAFVRASASRETGIATTRIPAHPLEQLLQVNSFRATGLTR